MPWCSLKSLLPFLCVAVMEFPLEGSTVVHPGQHQNSLYIGIHRDKIRNAQGTFPIVTCPSESPIRGNSLLYPLGKHSAHGYQHLEVCKTQVIKRGGNGSANGSLCFFRRHIRFFNGEHFLGHQLTSVIHKNPWLHLVLQSLPDTLDFVPRRRAQYPVYIGHH